MTDTDVFEVRLFGRGSIYKKNETTGDEQEYFIPLRPMQVFACVAIWSAAFPTTPLTHGMLIDMIWPKSKSDFDRKVVYKSARSKLLAGLYKIGVTDNPIPWAKTTIELNCASVKVDVIEFKELLKAVDKEKVGAKIDRLTRAAELSRLDLNAFGIDHDEFKKACGVLMDLRTSIRYQLSTLHEEQRQIEEAIRWAQEARDTDTDKGKGLDLIQRLEALRQPTNNLPEDADPFIGRQRETREIRELLGTVRFVTVTGPGGCGKTRVILNVANQMLGSFDEVWLVKLAELTEGSDILQKVATTVGQIGSDVTSEADLVDYLRTRKLLLVLDNCEHVLSSCQHLVTELLKACPHLKVLASSRIHLTTPGERVYIVPPMELPVASISLSEADLETYDSTLLFLSRAPHPISDSDTKAECIASICRRLEGLPLAIELAAAWLTALTPQEIRNQLEAGFDLLDDDETGQRQSTITATIAWSHGLLSDVEQKFFRRLSVFRGGWSAKAAATVCEGDGIEAGQVLALLRRLARHSLVGHKGDGSASRYQMLEMIREYGVNQLRASGEEERIRSKHLKYYVDFASDTSLNLRSATQMRQFDVFDQEYPNLLAGIEWCFGSIFHPSTQPTENIMGSLERVAELLSTLSRFLGVREHYSQVRKLFDAILAVRGSHPANLTWADVCHEAGGFARMQGDYERARHLYMEGFRIRNTFHDRQGIARSLYCIGLALSDEGRFGEAQPFFRSALDINRRLDTDSRFYIALCLNALGNIAWRLDNASEAEVQLAEALAIMRQLKDGQGTALVHYNLAYLSLSRNDFAGASRNFLASLAIERRIGDQPRIAEILEGFATLACARNAAENAVSLYAIANRLRENSGMPAPLKDQDRIKQDTDSLRTELGADQVNHRLSQIGNGSLDDELDRCCEGLRAEHPGIWENTLRFLDPSAERSGRRLLAAHLFVSIARIFRLHGQPQDAEASARPRENMPNVLQSSVFSDLGEAANVGGTYDLSAAYYSVGLELARLAENHPQIAICLEGLKNANVEGGNQ